jgi:hypothetical protein
MPSTRSCITLCESIDEACTQLLQHSFAVLRVEPEISDSLNAAWMASRNFLSSIHESHHDESCMTYRYRMIKDHALLGFNRPSPHKLLFRAFFSQGDEQDALQPWPSDIDSGALETSSTTLVPRLHNLLLTFHKMLKEETRVEDSHEVEERLHDANKRKRSYSKTNSFEENLAPCPLDYFLYHNRNEAENCSEHVDRGMLICISLSRHVAGLEVLSKVDGCWHCPEIITTRESLYEENDTGCSDFICILSGDQLVNSVGVGAESLKQNPGLRACVHRVRRRLSMARLSISYELRATEEVQSSKSR